MLGLAKLLAGMLIVLACAAPAAAAKRVALVIGNGTYKAQNLLVNPPNDARIVSDALAKAGFETIETKTDLGIAMFRQSLRRFQSQANGADVALIYYAGHGIEANGANWLIPTDADLAEDRDLDYEAIKADLVLQALQGANLRILVLDACRDNPFGRTWRSGTRNVSRGLAKIEADDVLVLFAAAPGRTASDGVGMTNSPFARALSKRLPEAGLAIQLLGGSVRDDVLAATNGLQRPYVSASITGRPFYLVPGTPAQPPSQTISPAPPSPASVPPSPTPQVAAPAVPPAAPLAPSQPPAETTKVAVAPLVDAPKAIATPTLAQSPEALREAAQRELKRIGCYAGEIDGEWGRGSQAALQEFRRRTRAQASGDAEPSSEVVAELRRHGPGTCPPAEVAKPAVAKPVIAKPKQPAQADSKPSPAPRRASQGPAESTGKSREQCMTCCLAQRFDPASFSSIRICEGFCSSKNNRC